MSNYHPAARAFEFGQTRQTIAIEGIRENCERGYNGEGNIMYEFEAERIETSENMAYCYGLEHISGERSGQPFEMYCCATYVFERVDSR
jgi:ketosteroid isomerase-like protein